MYSMLSSLLKERYLGWITFTQVFHKIKKTAWIPDSHEYVMTGGAKSETGDIELRVNMWWLEELSQRLGT